MRGASWRDANASSSDAPEWDYGAGYVPYKLAGLAGRNARAAGRAAQLNLTETNVLGAIIDLTASYSKLEDEVSHQQLVEMAGIPGEWRVAKRNLQRALEVLVELGIITYHPGRGRGVLSRVGLPSPATEKVAPTGHLNEQQKGGLRAREKVAPERAKRWPLGATHPSKDLDLPRNPVAHVRASDADRPVVDEGQAGLFEQPPEPQPPGQDLLEAVARAAPNPARHELLEDPAQGEGRGALRRRLIELEQLVGFEAAVTCVAGEWPERWRSAIALTNARARRRLEGAAAAVPPSPPAPGGQATLDPGWSTPQPPVWEPPAETARSPPPPDWRPSAFRKQPPRSEQ